VTSSWYGNFDGNDQAYDDEYDDEYDEYDEYDEPEPRNRAGRVIIVIASTVAAVLVITGIAWLALGKRHQGPPSDPASPSPAQVRLAAAARSYLAIADPSDKQLDAEEDAYADDERDNLAAARAELRAQVATERQFDTELAAIKFPGAVEATAQALIRANEARFRVTLRQARAKTLTALRALDTARKAGDAAVETQALLIRKELHLPPVPAS
jgi:hypothetical protein